MMGPLILFILAIIAFFSGAWFIGIILLFLAGMASSEG